MNIFFDVEVQSSPAFEPGTRIQHSDDLYVDPSLHTLIQLGNRLAKLSIHVCVWKTMLGNQRLMTQILTRVVIDHRR